MQSREGSGLRPAVRPAEGDLDTTLVSDLESQPLRVRAAQLVVRQGVDAGLRARIDVPTFVVGSGELADLRLTDPTVSRAHLHLSLEGDGVRLKDETSLNGTWVGDVRVQQALLTGTTHVTIGQTVIAIEVDAGQTDLAVPPQARFGEAIGVSSSMRHVFSLLEKAAAVDVTVLLEGESGVGKEVLARGVHAASPRRNGPMVTVDCGALPASLIESELFGHERYAFTGANQARRGLFEHACGGTLFLDEIGELPLELQPKLLRVLEEREVRPVGAQTPRPVDVRIVAATNRRLLDAVANGTFRSDLYYRLAVAMVHIAPLRDRPEDIAALATTFFRRMTGDARSTLPPSVLVALQSHPWPGNVRELRNVVERYALFGDEKTLFGPARDGEVVSDDLSHLPFHEARRIALERFEETYFPKVLARAGGVVSRAAQLAEVARPSFYRMLERVKGTKKAASDIE